MKADDVEGALTKVLAPGYVTNLDQFVTMLEKDKSFVPHGQLLHSFTVTPRKWNFNNHVMDIFINIYNHEILKTFSNIKNTYKLSSVEPCKGFYFLHFTFW